FRDDRPDRNDFGQADYSESYAYDPRRRAGYRAEDDYRGEDDYGQADYTRDYAYDPEERRAYRRYGDDDRGPRDARDYRREGDGYRDEREPRSWMDRAEAFFTGHPRGERYARRRRGPSDRVLWAVIMERLDDARVDARDVDVIVEDAEVTLNGAVRRKEDKRR